MRYVKRLHLFVLKSFLPLFAMTFFIVLFIVLMQFLWKYVDDLVGKGLELSVLGELFFYAAVCMVPMSLPLAILLASLMTFGNFGEKFELTAMKSSGISLLKVMQPLIVLIGCIAIGGFFFQNNVLPHAQVKMWTLLFSMKQKSPELEIPEGVFYDQIPGYNLFVKDKNRDTKMLYNVMIYDVTSGGDNSTILLADSAQLAFTKDMRHLYLHLFTGEQFENLRDQQAGDANIPFRREEFKDKQLLIPFDANFNRLDDQTMRQQYVGKNIAELRQTIDSVSRRVDSIGESYATMLRSEELGGVRPEMTTDGRRLKPYKAVATAPVRFDSLINSLPSTERTRIYSTAVQRAYNLKSEYEIRSMQMDDDRRSIRRHEIELIKKFTLSVACLVFFFIGAPLGAIIRKGGIGTPLVISVLLFLVYYIIDNTGYKMARDGRWNVYFGMWISTAILAPLGAYVTIKAMNDSAVFNKDAYRSFFRKILGLREERYIVPKEVIINDISESSAIEMLESLRAIASAFVRKHSGWQSYKNYWLFGLDREAIAELRSATDNVCDYLMDCRNLKVVLGLANFPVLRSLWLYAPARRAWLSWTFIVLLPVGVPVWLFGMAARKRLVSDVEKIVAVSSTELDLLQGKTPEVAEPSTDSSDKADSTHDPADKADCAHESTEE